MAARIHIVRLFVGTAVLCVAGAAYSGEGAGLPSEAGGIVAAPVAAEPALELSGKPAPAQTRVLGSTDRTSGFKFEVELTSLGAAISRATLSEFKDRDRSGPKPLVLLGPMKDPTTTTYPLASGHFYYRGDDPTVAFPLHKLHWKADEVAIDPKDGSQSVAFEAALRDASGTETVRFAKTYRVAKDSYDLECTVVIENLSAGAVKGRFLLYGPGGMGREDPRRDMRSVVAAYMTAEGVIESARLDHAKLRKAVQHGGEKDRQKLQLGVAQTGAHFLWAAATNKYFTAILRPVPDGEDKWMPDVSFGEATYHDPDLTKKQPSPRASSGFTVEAAGELAAAGQPASSKRLAFAMYLGPKDKSLFDANALYRKLGYYHTIDFMPCCMCPQAITNPLAFGIMALMKWMYRMMGSLGNYGVVIMILVVVVRAMMLPLTIKSQSAGLAMQKLGPQVEELRKKYASNPAEMNKQIMLLYRSHGANYPMLFVPMFIQMPIWIALWSAVYASVDLRGAGFLPFWITDLSGPDALIRFGSVNIPLIGQIDSFNLLPFLMGVFMYLQQKLTPTAANAQTNPQVAQQQKMMMIMMPILFPIMLYNGPSGVNLYIMSSMAAGVGEQVVIRRRLKRREERAADGQVPTTSKLGGKAKKKKPKPLFKYH